VKSLKHADEERTKELISNKRKKEEIQIKERERG
jgi:hypothetical protein